MAKPPYDWDAVPPLSATQQGIRSDSRWLGVTVLVVLLVGMGSIAVGLVAFRPLAEGGVGQYDGNVPKGFVDGCVGGLSHTVERGNIRHASVVQRTPQCVVVSIEFDDKLLFVAYPIDVPICIPKGEAVVRFDRRGYVHSLAFPEDQ